MLDVFDNIMHMLVRNSFVDMVYLNFSKVVGITGIIGFWLYHFLTDRSHFVRLPGGISEDHPVLSGVPQGTGFEPSPVLDYDL